jgi:hypothetical protein
MARKAEPEHYSGDGDCPHCGAIDSLGIPVDQGFVHWIIDSYTVHGTLDFRRCEACGDSCYCVRLDLIRNPDIRDELTHEYLWSNKPIQGRTTVATVRPGWNIRGLPEEWRVTQTETMDGMIERHFFGPFPYGRNEWALNDSIKGPWKHGMWIISRVVKRLTRPNAKKPRTRRKPGSTQ